MIKIRKSGKEINPHAGVNFCIDIIEDAGIPAIIENALGQRGNGKRGPKPKYSFSDTILGLTYGILAGGDRLKDMKGLKAKLDNPMLNIPSPNVISTIIRDELSVESETVTAESGNVHQFNLNPKLNELLLDVALHLDTLDTKEEYTLDYDNTVIACDKWDAEWTYKKFRGYTPGISWIGRTPVYIEGMNGGNPPKYQIFETMKRNFELLDSRGIKIGKFRSDAAGYQSDLVELCDSRGIDFFIRANHCKAMWEKIKEIKAWKKARIDVFEFEVEGFQYKPFGSDKEYRIMVSRIPNDTGENHNKTGEPFVYRCVLTNNIKMSDQDVLEFYNFRGDIERNYDIMNNDFLWKNLPFSFMHENSAFMLITAISNVLYQFLIDIFAARVDFVELTDRMKTFRLNFISLSGEWIKDKNSDDVLLIHDNSRDWSRLAG